MNLCASSQWEMVYWLVLCCEKIGTCVLSYGWSCFQLISGQFDGIFAQGHMKGNFHSVGEKSFLQCELIGSRWITHIVPLKHFRNISSFKNGQWRRRGKMHVFLKQEIGG